MKNSSSEMMKLFDFILESKITIDDNSLFNIEVLRKIRSIAKNEIPNNFNLSKEQKNLLIQTFIRCDKIFDKNTPYFLLKNKDCVIASIKQDINSVGFINIIDEDIKQVIEKEALKQGYILTENSPKFIKRNYIIAKNSVKLDAFSADYINWDYLEEDKVHNLLQTIKNSNYVLSKSSSKFLISNREIVLSSVKQDISTIEFALSYIKSDSEIFKLLIKNNYKLTSPLLKTIKLINLCDEEILDYYFSHFDLYSKKSNEFKARIRKIILDTLKVKPKVSSFNFIFQVIAEMDWDEYRRKNINMYENIFGKICAELRNNYSSFEEIVDNLVFLKEMKNVLTEKYQILYQAMQEYYNIFHSGTNNKLAKLKSSQEIIAKSAAIFVSKSKEIYKKEQIKIYQELIKPYFKVKSNNPIALKKIILKIQREKFKELYESCDSQIIDFINSIIEKYNKQSDEELIKRMIKEFVINEYSDVNKFISKPSLFDEITNYEKVTKLINRLNRGYISINGIEVKKYKYLIRYDENTRKYCYDEKINSCFLPIDFENYNDYKNKLKLYHLIKRDIMLKIKDLSVTVTTDQSLLEEIASTFDFNDEDYEFDMERNLKLFDFNDIRKVCLDDKFKYSSESFLDNESYKNIYNHLVVNGLNWLLMILQSNSYTVSNKFTDYGICRDEIFNIINNMHNIVAIAKELKIDTSNFKELLSTYKITKSASMPDLAILGKNIIENLCTHKSYTSKDETKIITMAKDMICQMSKRNKATVPYVFGNYLGYKYSMYDPLDESILLTGINTNSCFKIDGSDHDFLHYCALNKNGFIIKITDCFDNFVARASGFRNGNALYINQLRTIYDDINKYEGIYELEKNDIIETFKKACMDIIHISQNNNEEKQKIEFVFVNQSYALDNIESNVSDEVEDFLSGDPMDNKSNNWNNYVENTKNLKESKEGLFITDFGDYPLICLTSSRQNKQIKVKDIKQGNVKAVYKRVRNKVIVKQNPDANVLSKINKIRAIKAYFDDELFSEVFIPQTSTVFLGDNWYIILSNNEVIDECLLEFDSDAQKEYQATIESIKNIINYNSQEAKTTDQLLRDDKQAIDENIKILMLRN